ncbi:hypothetical protein BpHYR1_047657 [Brachionus plicatilis]|uniref:Uncharacterized protein n=1 Tax=Brachionus plicatilis TaxID=10195 RepID=A0A3M7RY21_BRAPC|nr:hypothetical protein BpHYR1_047657 [Brachionus plicatilis]
MATHRIVFGQTATVLVTIAKCSVERLGCLVNAKAGRCVTSDKKQDKYSGQSDARADYDQPDTSLNVEIELFDYQSAHY